MDANEPMNPNQSTDATLDAYLDGALGPDERRAFEQRLRSEPELADALQRQRQLNRSVEESLKRVIAAPAASAAVSVLARIGAEQQRGKAAEQQRGRAAEQQSGRAPEQGRLRLTLGHLGFTLRSWAAAALLAVAVLSAVWAMWPYVASKDPHAMPRLSLADYYNRKVHNYTPYWQCETDKQFTDSIVDRFGQPLLMPVSALPAGIAVHGLDYCHTLSPRTIAVLLEAEGSKIIVLVDAAESAAHHDAAGSGSKEVAHNLHAHSRSVGGLALVEVSPFDQPRTLDLFSAPPPP